MKNILYEEFCRKYKITGASSNLKQTYRLISQFFEFISNKYPSIQSLEILNNDHSNAYYNHLKNKCWRGEISKSYLKDTLYAANRLFREIGKPELVYNVTKIIKSLEGKKSVIVTLEEFDNIKKWRRKYGKVMPPE